MYWDKLVKIWDLINDNLKNTFDKSNGCHCGQVLSLALLENGFLASGSDDFIRDITSCKLKTTLTNRQTQQLYL
jgi:hypothetical protein